ncbi:MAG: hypothetical protein QOI66_3380 [Myxococcales bacterium]|nr:hypothetical protein [Myxococcales bacterium]
MKTGDLQVLALGIALLTVVAPLACRTQASGQPPETPASATTTADGGPPLPPPSSRHGVIVPNDVGMGAGPSGPATNTGSTSGGSSNPIVNPPAGGH